MDNRTHSRGPLLIAIVFLSLALYVGSYLALVTPGPLIVVRPGSGSYAVLEGHRKYRVAPALAEDFFWPLEQLDRKVRPRAWNDSYPLGQHVTPRIVIVEEDETRLGIDFEE
jgi:hypothetical protein